MKYLLCGINAKYIHSNLAIHCLKSYAKKWGSAGMAGAEIELCEYTINHYMDQLLQALYSAGADILVLSCYIWNVSVIKELTGEMKKILPGLEIWVGGPEVSYNTVCFLRENPGVDLVMRGEGEELFTRLVELREAYGDRPGFVEKEDLSALKGIAYRKEGHIIDQGMAPCVDLNQVPFVYEDFGLFKNKILYYETSRGCPFCCSYCLSSVDEKVRFRSSDLVEKELDAFLEAKVPQVKFVDRTFNCNKRHAMFIWNYIKDHDNGLTNFHFEIAGDLLDEDSFTLFQQMRPGLIQLEIGVQSTNPATLAAIRRKMDLKQIFSHVDQIRSMGNIHQHLDLIAGLPYENYEQFGKSFDDLYVHEPDQLQLGFLKVLKGTYMEKKAGDYGIQYRKESPYEVLGTRWMSYGDLLKLKGVEELTEAYYNSGQFHCSLRYAVPAFSGPFAFFRAFSRYHRRQGAHLRSHSRLARYEILRDFLMESGINFPFLDQMLVMDLYLREKAKARPAWAGKADRYRDFFKKMYREQGEILFPGLTASGTYDSKKMAGKSHMEIFSLDMKTYFETGEIREGTFCCLFDYQDRDPLSHNARLVCIEVPAGTFNT